MTRTERVEKWASELDVKQIQELLVETVGTLIDMREVSFPLDSKAPYWAGDGEPLIEGQVTFEDDKK